MRPAAPGCNLRPLRPGLPIYRSDALTGLSADERSRVDALGLTTLIDLRHRHEIEAWPCDLSAVPSVDYRWVDLSGGLRSADGSVVGGSTPIRSLADLYLALLTRCTVDLRTVVEAVVKAPGPVLFHCAAGKDRTGVVAALVLGLLGASDEDILADYLATGPAIGPLLPFLRAGLDLQKAGPGAEAFLETKREFLDPALDFLAAQGGIEAYVVGTLGIPGQALVDWRSRITAERR